MPNRIYFYNALSQPVLIATSIRELTRMLKITHSYKGDVTHEVKGIVRGWLRDAPGNMAFLKEELAEYDLFINPEQDEFFAKNRRSGLRADAHNVINFCG